MIVSWEVQPHTVRQMVARKAAPCRASGTRVDSDQWSARSGIADTEEHIDALKLWRRHSRRRVVLRIDDRSVRSVKSRCRNARRLMAYAFTSMICSNLPLNHPKDRSGRQRREATVKSRQTTKGPLNA